MIFNDIRVISISMNFMNMIHSLAYTKKENIPITPTQFDSTSTLQYPINFVETL